MLIEGNWEVIRSQGKRVWLKRKGPNKGKTLVRPDKTEVFIPNRPKENGFKIVKQTGNALVIDILGDKNA